MDALEKSLIENLQRDDLSSAERENAVGDLWDSKRYSSYKDIAEKLGINKETVSKLLEARELRKSESLGTSISSDTIGDTRGLSVEPRKKLLEIASEKGIGDRKIREIVRKIKTIPDEEKQMEALDLYGQESEVTEEVLDEAVTRLKEEAEGTRPMMFDDGKTSDDKRLDIIKNNLSGVYSVTTN